MSDPDCTVSLKPNSLMRCEARPFAFAKKSASFVQGIPGHSIPLRVAVIGNHLPRQCGIATFTTDLCDAIAAEYGAAGVAQSYMRTFLLSCANRMQTARRASPLQTAEKDTGQRINV